MAGGNPACDCSSCVSGERWERATSAGDGSAATLRVARTGSGGPRRRAQTAAFCPEKGSPSPRGLPQDMYVTASPRGPGTADRSRHERPVRSRARRATRAQGSQSLAGLALRGVQAAPGPSQVPGPHRERKRPCVGCPKTNTRPRAPPVSPAARSGLAASPLRCCGGSAGHAAEPPAGRAGALQASLRGGRRHHRQGAAVKCAELLLLRCVANALSTIPSRSLGKG